MTNPPWLSLLAPLPAEGGEWTQETRTDPALKGWTQVRLVLGDGVTGLRVLTAMFDPEGRPGSVSDLVSRDGGRHPATSGRARARAHGARRGRAAVACGGVAGEMQSLAP